MSILEDLFQHLWYETDVYDDVLCMCVCIYVNYDACI